MSNNIDLSQIKKIFFIGIGGTSMSGLAQMAFAKGFDVLGSDMKPCVYTEKLEDCGVTVYIGHKAEHITKDIDLVVYSAAIRDSNSERLRAKELAIPAVDRAIFLGLISNFYPKTIAVSGTHGKTTTSSLMSLVFLNAGLDPSISIGGSLRKINGNSRVGNSEFFVIEACEFVDSFLHTNHFVGTIQNIEKDHLDYFTNGIEQIKKSFKKFAEIIPNEGLLAANGDDKHVKEIIKGLKCNVVTFGKNENNDFIVKNIEYNDEGKPSFEVYKNGEFYHKFDLNIPGEHNVFNAMSCVVVGDFFGIDKEDMNESFKEFLGAKRRFEIKGVVNDITVVEDYAHHPTELKVTIEACKNHPHNNLYVIFQPHTYSRTFLLFDEFVESMKGADILILDDIYSDREENDWDIYSVDIARKVKEQYGVPSRVINTFEGIRDYIIENAKSGDMVLVVGAGSINQVAYDIVDKLNELHG